MRISISSLLLLAATAAAQTLWLAGDSTMALGGGGPTIPGTQGWGEYLQQFFTITVVNDGVAGRSARSYTEEGRFAAIAANLTAGDWVIMEFGHNDGGLTFTTPDNGREDCPPNGSYNSTCATVYNGTSATNQSYTSTTVHTYTYYEEAAAKLFQSLGAHVIISTMTPSNPWETGTFTWSETYYYTYAHDAATATGSDFVDHGLYIASTYQHMNASAVDALFPIDHTHTAPAGADLVAKCFVEALEQSNSTLKMYVKTGVDYET